VWEYVTRLVSVEFLRKQLAAELLLLLLAVRPTITQELEKYCTVYSVQLTEE